MSGGPNKKKVMQNVASYVRDNIKKNYSAADLHDPADNGATLATVANIQQWAEAGRMATVQLAKQGKRLNSQVEYLEAVQKKYLGVYTQAATGLANGQQAITDFNTWKGNEGYDAWAYFESLQGPGATEAKEVVAQQQRLQHIADRSNLATSIAVAERNNHSGGPDAVVGTVICGMADANGNTYLGTSGHGALHPVMSKLLQGVGQAEKWPINVCGEIDAMNQYLAANAWTDVSQIPKGELFSHAETWDAKQRKWKSRGACANCEQWLSKIHAHMA